MLIAGGARRLGGMVFIIGLVSSLLACGGSPGGPKPPPAGEEPPAPVGGTCHLCGLPAPADDLTRRPVAVVIDNTPGSAGQSGLAAACIVYEVLVEGGITRLVAVYLHGEADPVGPVRSARDYFLDLVREWDAVLAHAGGSPGALEQIGSGRVDSLDGLSRDKGFWRVSGGAPPYNLYTSTAALREGAAAKGLPMAKVPHRSVHLDAAGESGSEEASFVRIPYPDGFEGYAVEYRYRQETSTYARFLGGQPHFEAKGGKQLEARTVIVQYVATRLLDKEGRLEMDIVGRGRALILAGGRLTQGTWVRESVVEPTKFYGPHGKLMHVPAGQVWIQVVPLRTLVSWG